LRKKEKGLPSVHFRQAQSGWRLQPLRQDAPGFPSALLAPSGVQSLAIALLANGNVNLLMAQK
jgi:hypothetical protein